MAGDAAFDAALQAIPEGVSRMRLRGQSWIVTRRTYASGRSVKLVAEALDGRGYVSMNYYRLRDGRALLKPCEMPAETVIDFVLNARPVTDQ